MVQYKISLKLKGSLSPNELYSYSLNLQSHQENNPEQIFTKEIRESLRNNLQHQSSCKIDDNHQGQIIKHWIQDIKEGYRDSIITLDLPPLLLQYIDRLTETGNQELPGLIGPDLSSIEPRFGMLPPLNFF